LNLFRVFSRHFAGNFFITIEEFDMSKILMTVVLLLCTATIAFSQKWMNGKWEGTGYQTDSQETWTMKLRAQKKKFIIEYPSLNCSGTWTLLNFNSNRARFRETIKENREACEPRGNVTIEKLNSRQIMFLYRYRGTSEVSASAILNRSKKRTE
jgi:hypothetical protein